MRPLPGATRDDGYHKPAIIKLYDFTKGGTDIVDQLNDYHTCRSRIFRWDVVVLFYMLDTIRVNSKTIWCIKQGLHVQKFKSFDFAWELAMQLIKPFIRSRNINGLPRMTLKRMRESLVKKLRFPHKQMEKESNILTQARMKGEGASSVKKEAASRRSPIYQRRRKTASHAG